MGPMLQPYIAPFLAKVAHSPAPPKRVYWVSPPETERIARPAHDILVERLRATEGDWLKVIDSRLLLKYPYRNLQPDKQHFFGPDAVIWADGVFDIIKKDLEAAPLASSTAPTNLLPPPPPRQPLPKSLNPLLQHRFARPSTSKPLSNTSPSRFRKRRLRPTMNRWLGSFIACDMSFKANSREPTWWFFMRHTLTESGNH